MMNASFVIAAALIVAGIATSIYWSGTLTRLPQVGWQRFVSGCLLGSGFCLIGIVNLVETRRSGHSFATGVVSSVGRSQGRNPKTTLVVLRADGTWLYANCDYFGNHLLAGENVSIEVLDYESTLLHLKVLDGQFAGWTLNEGDGSLFSIFAIAVGLFLIVSTRAKWKRDPEGVEDEVFDTKPREGVDTRSMLDLSPRKDD